MKQLCRTCRTITQKPFCDNECYKDYVNGNGWFKYEEIKLQINKLTTQKLELLLNKNTNTLIINKITRIAHEITQKNTELQQQKYLKKGKNQKTWH